MHIWVDADSCPVNVRHYISNCALQFSINVVFVANHFIPIDNIASPFVSFELCSPVKDSADNFIFNSVEKTDIVITRDILFAERLVNADISVMNDRGTLFTKKNIDKFVSERNLSLMVSNLGIKNGYSKKVYDKNEFSLFCKCFNEVLRKKLS